MSGSGISWAVCKSAPRCRQTTMPAPHHSLFTGWMPFLLPNQQRQSTYWCTKYLKIYQTDICQISVLILTLHELTCHMGSHCVTCPWQRWHSRIYRSTRGKWAPRLLVLHGHFYNIWVTQSNATVRWAQLVLRWVTTLRVHLLHLGQLSLLASVEWEVSSIQGHTHTRTPV